MLVNCPQCKARLMIDIANIGKKGQCPKCNHSFTVEKPLTEPPKHPNSVTSIEEIKPTTPLLKIDEEVSIKAKRIKCDKYWLSYNSKIFVVEGANGQVRFPLRTQMALSYKSHNGDDLAIFIRIASILLVWMLIALLIRVIENNKNGNITSLIFALTIIAFITLLIFILVLNFIKYGLFIKQGLEVNLRIGGETNRFLFKNDREEAKNFFLEVEELSHNSN